MARIIILNGISSAGKSTLAKAIQDAAQDDWLHVSLDQFISMLPDGREMAPEWFTVSRTDEDRVSIMNGPRGGVLMETMRDFVRIAANRGIDIVVDDVATITEIDDYRQKLAKHSTFVVKVDVPLETAKRRERERGDRMIGLARDQWERIHQGIDYDIVVSNDDDRTDACADAILTRVTELTAR